MTSEARPRVGLFVTCLVDLVRPSVGFSAAKLLAEAGCEVVVPSQTCCGQPAFNNGDRASARDIALLVMDAFANCDFVVAPSGSCAGMLRAHYPELFAGEPKLAARAGAFAGKCHELTSFLVDVMKVERVAAAFPKTVAYHDSCSGLRELGVAALLLLALDLLAGGRGSSLLFAPLSRTSTDDVRRRVLR